MKYENILVDKKEEILWITINRESKLNALNKQTLDELNDAIFNAQKHPMTSLTNPPMSFFSLDDMSRIFNRIATKKTHE